MPTPSVGDVATLGAGQVTVALLCDVLAITLLAGVLYRRRHARMDLVFAYFALNAGVLAVTLVLLHSGAGVGLGLGLFGILSIIRLRSDQISQSEVAYYFVALALGLLAGLMPSPAWLCPVLSALLVGVAYAADHPRLQRHVRRQTVVLDVACTDAEQARYAAAAVVPGELVGVDVVELDMVRDTTVVDVRYRPTARPTDTSMDITGRLTRHPAVADSAAAETSSPAQPVRDRQSVLSR